MLFGGGQPNNGKEFPRMLGWVLHWVALSLVCMCTEVLKL